MNNNLQLNKIKQLSVSSRLKTLGQNLAEKQVSETHLGSVQSGIKWYHKVMITDWSRDQEVQVPRSTVLKQGKAQLSMIKIS